MVMAESVSRQRVNKPVGLTGGIGSGKSSVARFCVQQFGIRYIDADLVCRQLLAPQAKGWQVFKKNFGSDFLDAEQKIDRQRLREAIFRDPALRQQLDELIHPLARIEIQELLSSTEQPCSVLVEVPLLYEAGWEDDFRSIIVVHASDECCLERLMQRDNVDRTAAMEALAAQMPLAEKVRRADHVIDNSGSWQDTCQQLQQLEKLLRCKE